MARTVTPNIQKFFLSPLTLQLNRGFKVILDEVELFNHTSNSTINYLKKGYLQL
jgi:hypothetical protein